MLSKSWIFSVWRRTPLPNSPSLSHNPSIFVLEWRSNAFHLCVSVEGLRRPDLPLFIHSSLSPSACFHWEPPSLVPLTPQMYERSRPPYSGRGPPSWPRAPKEGWPWSLDLCLCGNWTCWLISSQHWLIIVMFNFIQSGMEKDSIAHLLPFGRRWKK